MYTYNKRSVDTFEHYTSQQLNTLTTGHCQILYNLVPQLPLILGPKHLFS